MKNKATSKAILDKQVLIFEVNTYSVLAGIEIRI